MKKCPTCNKTFEDSFRFCQTDGTPLVDDAPALDPYATIVQSHVVAAPAETPAETTPEDEAELEPPIHQTVGSMPISEPEDVLDLPEADPLKTVVVSQAEMQAALSGEILANEITLDSPPVETEPEAPLAEETPTPEPPSFSVPDIPAPSFADAAPPPSPFSHSESPNGDPSPTSPSIEEPLEAPAYEELSPADTPKDDLATMILPAATPPLETPSAPSETPPAAPSGGWEPPPAPVAAWENQEIGSNTPFQPPATGTEGQNTTLGLVSLILGIASFICLGLLGSIPAIILGMMQRSKIKNNPNEFGGSGMALAGIILGALNIVVSVVVLVIYVIVIASNMR